VIEAFADNTVKIGKYGSNSITISGSKIAINSDSVDANFPFFVGDRSIAGARYSLTNKGMGFNLADNYAQLQLYGGNGSYIDFVTASGQDSAGRIMWDGNFNISGTTYFANNIYTYTLYDRNDNAYYLDMNGTSRLGTLNINQLSVYGNTYLGDGNGDEVHINDILRVGATDSGDSHFYFGEGSLAGSDYGSHWYWDSGYTFTWNTRNNGTDTALFDYVTNDTTYINWRRNFHMQNREINYTAQLHFNGGTRFVTYNSNYLYFQPDSTSVGGILVRDGNSSTRGYSAYFDGSGFGLLNSTGNWGIRLNPGNVGTELFYAGSLRLDTRSGGVGVQGNVYTNADYGYGLVGLYSSVRYQGVFAMSNDYKLLADGTGTGNLYGIAWTHTNVGGQSKTGLDHQALFVTNGITQTAIGTGIWTSGLITTTSYGTSANWNTAFGWGNHASAGYLTSLPSHNHDDRYYTESEIDSQISARLYQTSGGTIDVNAFNSTGLYRGSTGSWTNRPSITDNSGALLQIDTHPGNYHTQLFFDSSGTRLYLRSAIAGSWGSWVTMWHSGNLTNLNQLSNGPGYVTSSGSVNYATSAGNADTVDGYHATNAASGLAYYASNGYLYVPSWINVGSAGIFSSTNNAHIRPNTGAYGAWEMIGSKGSWAAIYFNDSSNYLMANNNEVGHYQNGIGWKYRWYQGTMYISRGTTGGGTEFTVLDSGNYTSYSPSLTGSGASGTWGINVTGSAGSAGSATTSTNLAGPGASYIQSTSAGTSYGANYQVRENSGGSSNTNEIYAPQLAFHWAGVVASSIMMESSGRMAIRNNPGGSYENFIAAVIYSSGYGDSTQWNTAYGWGNHASAGYQAASTAITTSNIGSQTVATAGALSSMNISQFTNNSGYLTSLPSHNHDDRYYTETESDSRYLILGGSWGADLTSNGWTRKVGYAADGGEWVLLSASGQISSLLDGSYFAGEQGGFYSMGNSNTYASRRGFYNDGTYANFNTPLKAASYVLNTGAFMEGYGTYSSKLGRVAMISLDWNSNYDEPANHGIMSTNSNGDFADSLSINSFNDITLRLDANNNNAESYVRIMNNTQGANTIAYIGHDGSSSVAWFGGVVTAANDFRAPIFYDSANTNFYGDFASTSVVNAIRFGNSSNNGTLSAPSDWGVRITTDAGYINFGPANGSYAHIYTDRGSFYFNAQLDVIGNRVLHAGNYTSYSPSLTGSGASGTWGISITGNSNYATTAGSAPANGGNSSTVGGYSVSVGASANTIPTRNASGYFIPESWIQFNGIYGLYSPTNGAHLRPNDGSYGSWLVTGSRNGWQGIEFNSGTNGNVTMMIATDSRVVGFHNNSYGWQIRWDNGTLYIGKGANGGTDATILDSSNYSSWAQPIASAINTGNIGSQSVSYATTAGTANAVAWTNVSSRPTALSQFSNDLGNYGGWITSSGNAATATNVAWTGVTGRPTALSQFSNDLGNYGGWLTTGGKAADSELFDGTDSIYFVKGNGTNALGRTTTNNSGGNSAGGLSSGFYDGSGMSNMPTSDWYHLIVNSHHNSATTNQYEFQLATAFWDKSNFYVRSISPGDVGPWRTLVHNGNIGSQSVSYASTSGSATTAGSATMAQQLSKFGDIYGQDWNSYYVSGKLIVANALGHSGANRPNLTYDYGVALSYGETGGPLLQMYFPENSGNIGTIFRKGTYRTGWNGNWSTWKTLVEQEGNTCTIVGGNGTGLEVHGNVGYNQDPLTYFLIRGQADTSWKALKIRLTGDAGGQDIEFRRIAENGTDSRMWYVPRGGNTVNFDYPIVQPSDSRLKDNITSISTPVEKIKSLRGVEFDWNSGEQVGTHDVGLIAQDVEAVLPEAVTTQEDGYKNLAYTKVIPLLVEAMKEQQTMIEALRAEVELLKSK
jgi:hypothetical protein